MKIDITKIPEKSQVELKIVVPAQRVAPFFEKAAAEISKEKPLKGFRPGKAPANVVAESFGTEHLLQQALEKAVPQFFVEAAIEHEVDAITRPSVAITKAGLTEDLEFTATVDVLPEVKLGDPKKVKVEKRDVTVDDEQIEKELQYLAKSRSNHIDVARPAKEGDVVTVDFEIEVDGKPIEGGSSKNHPVPIGEGHFVPDFEKGIIGIAVGDTRQFDFTFPEDYNQQALRGKKASARVKAHRVQQRSLPKIDDEFAKTLGKFESLEGLKKQLRENTEKELVEREQDRYFGEIAEKFADLTEFGYVPQSLIDREIDSRLQELAQMLAVQQRSIEDYLHQQKKTIEEVRDDMKKSAEKNVKIGLTLRQFAKEHTIEVPDEEIEQEAIKHLQHYHSPDQAESEVDPDQLKEHVASILRNRKTLETLAKLSQ